MATLDFSNWPVVPQEQRPKKLYYLGQLDGDQGAALIAAGWDPIDVRLLPQTTDDEQVAAIKAWLQGLRLGSIESKAGQVKFAELEGKLYGALSARKVADSGPVLDKASLESILNFAGGAK